MVAIQILSDLHLERPQSYGHYTITPRAPHLALLGDIGSVQQDTARNKHVFKRFLLRHLKLFRTVLYVPGNHEPYHTTWAAADAFFRGIAELARARRDGGEEDMGEFVYLDCGRYDLPGDNNNEEGVTILGCTLFSHVPGRKRRVVSRGISDFRKIKEWNVDAHNSAHDQHLWYLNLQVENADKDGRKVIILTHHSPTVDDRAVEDVYRGDELTSAFVTDLSGEKCWTSYNVKVWAFGHTHYNCDFVDEWGKRVYTNQKGYAGDGKAKGYDKQRVVVV